MPKKGIFCLEGFWEDDLRKKSTVQPILELLKFDGIPYIYLDCATFEEFEFYLTKWTQKKYQKYPILYLAFHGKKGKILISKKGYELKDIGEFLADKCNDSVVIFGSCSVLNISRRHVKDFLKKTNSLAVGGYAKDVDWIVPTAFELLVLSTLQENVFTRRGIERINTKIKRLSKSKPFKDLNFRFFPSRV